MDQEHRYMHDKIEQLLTELKKCTEELFPQEAGSPSLDTQMVGETLFQIYQKIVKGMTKITKLLTDPSFYHESSRLIPAMTDMATVASVIMRQAQPALALLAQGNSLQEIIGISNNTMESLYSLAKYLYEQQLYEEAAGSFYLLSFLQPGCELFWLGLGNAEFFQENFKEASLAYSLAVQINGDNPLYHLLAAKCYAALNNTAAAMTSLGIAQLCDPKQCPGIDIKKQISQLAEKLKK